MKKVILSILLVGSVFTSCSDAYEVEQPGTVTDEAKVFRNAADVARGVMGVYSIFGTESEIAFSSVFTDECGIGVSNGGQGVNDGSYRFMMTPANSFATSLWGSNYGTINRVNRILNRIEELYKIVPEEKDQLDKLKGTLLAIRAYSNFKLFAYFTPNYTDANGLSIMKFDFMQTDDYSKVIPREKVSVIVKFIEDDIAAARNLGIADASDLNFAQGTESGNAIFGTSLLDVILVKLYSMTENYAGLEEAFNRLDGYSVGTYQSYRRIFLTEEGANNPDVILRAKRFDRVGGGPAGTWYNEKVGIGSSMIYYEIGRSLYNALDNLDPDLAGTEEKGGRNDARYSTVVSNESTIKADYASLSQEDYRLQDVLLIGKYPGRTTAPLVTDVITFRYTDMLLALAEKRAADGKLNGPHVKGDFSNVESIIYHIRINRSRNEEVKSIMPVITTKQSAWKAILDERRVEFAFEGHRYLDVRRLGVKAGVNILRDAQDCAAIDACSLDANSFKMVLPIPSTEMITNPTMAGKQNPGY